MRTLGMLAAPLLGKAGPNAQFLEALLRYSSFEELALFISETADLAAIEQLTQDWDVPEERLAAYSTWQLPELLARGRVDVLHHPALSERLFDLVSARDRFANKATPVTGQLTSPSRLQGLARQLLVRPTPSDAVFCSSVAGRGALEHSFERLEQEARAVGLTGPLPRWDLPLLSWGVEVDALIGGDRSGTRQRLAIPDEACLLTCLTRFGETDAVDLFPVLRVLERLVHEPAPGAPPVYLLVGGARQNTKAPEMLELWARHLGVHERLRLELDFPATQKKHLLAASELFLSPVDNVDDGSFGQPVMEALAAGIPVVASDFGAARELVDERVGVRVPTRINADWSELSPLISERALHLVLGQSVELELTALEAALRALISDRPRREQLGKAAAEKARAHFDWRVLIPAYEYEWHRLAASGAQPGGKAPPLRLEPSDFGAGGFDASRRVVRSERADDFVIHPELKHLFVEEDVRALLINTTSARTLGELEAQMTARLGDRRRWVARFAVGWLLKQGLLQTPSVDRA